MTPLIFLDTETTGLCPDIHTPWEIAWRTALHDTSERRLQLVDGFRAYVKLSPKRLAIANDAAMQIGRFHQRYGVDGPVIEVSEAISMLQADCANICRGTEQTVPHLIGAVPGFDHAMLCMNHIGWPDFGEGLWHYRLVCWENLAAAKLGIPPGWSTSDLLARLGVAENPDTKHTAMGDVDTAVAAYAAVYGLEVT